jgi:hypothetical protein
MLEAGASKKPQGFALDKEESCDRLARQTSLLPVFIRVNSKVDMLKGCYHKDLSSK